MHPDGSSTLKIGVVGFSAPFFDHAAAKALLVTSIQELIARAQGASIEIVSGLTNAGVPRIAYLHASERGFRTTGISARKALSVSSGVFAVDLQILEGLEFGDESHRFVHYIDCLIRIGGGLQSRREVSMFRERCMHEGLEVAERLIEHELALQLPDDAAIHARSATT